MESITELPDKMTTAAPLSSTHSDTNISQTGLTMSKAPILSPNATRRKGSSKTAAPPSMKRAASTPNVRSVAGAEALAISLAEKRRNKLGYHRTSVACGHCRRRKIRCLLAPEDPQGKCQNCVRLKKECNFFPVEQHQESDERPGSDSRFDVTSNEAGTSDSSSPSFSGSRGTENFDESNYRLQHLPSSGVHQDVRSGEALSRSLTNMPNPGPPSARTYDHFPTHEQNGTWTSPYLQQSPQDMVNEESQTGEPSYWRPHELSLPTSYPQHPYSLTHPSGSFAQSPQSSMQQNPDFGQRGPHGWVASPHPPLRTMSLVGSEELLTQYQNHYYHDAPNDYRQSTNDVDMPPPTLSSNDSTMSSSDPPLPLASMGSFQDPTPQNINYVYPPTWNSVPPNHNQQIHGPITERFTQGWYSDHSVLAQVKEDEVGAHFHHQPHSGYLPHQANPG